MSPSKPSEAPQGPPRSGSVRRPPYSSGELLGLEYLYSQIGTTLTVEEVPKEEQQGAPAEEQQEAPAEEQQEAPAEEQQDEGFVDGETDVSARVLMSPSLRRLMSLSISPQPSRPGSTTTQAPVLGPDGAAGWEKVQDLAEHLLSLRDAAYLDEQQVTQTIRLWGALSDRDKRLHYQLKRPKGGRQATKGGMVKPGVAGPSRLMEAMSLKLRALHKSSHRRDRDRNSLPLWKKMLTDYNHIRELVRSCHALMEATSLHLFLPNEKTIVQWFQRMKQKHESSVLQEGLARQSLPSTSSQQEETPSTGRASKLRPGRKAASATAVQPLAPAPPQLLPLPAAAPLSGLFILSPVGMSPRPALSVCGPFAVPPSQPQQPQAPGASPVTSRSTFYYKPEDNYKGSKKRRIASAIHTCSKCKQPKTKEFGHRNYGTAYFCPQASEGKSVEQWLEEQRQKDKPENPSILPNM
uniref:Uncharacterized protein n=1 Tax=Knipowitschia caucasica TaxID=637954 RepID=A0AAV2M599_KNICA